MFSLMGNCVSCIKKRREPKRPVTLAILGLDCAGKTTTTGVLMGDPLDENIAPTVGFNTNKFTLGKFDITMFDLGGGKQIRAVWPTYLPEVYGIVYMIDSTAAERMEELKHNFRELVENGKVAGKPILVLANKQDKEDALDEVDICEQLMLEHTVNSYKCPCRVESCSAIRGTGRKMDPTIKEGMQWLCDVIEKNFDTLKARIDEDMAEAAEQRKIEAAARRERVRKIREERERAAEEERKKLGIEKPDSDQEDFIDGNPFKRVDVEELNRKEAKMKEEKKKKKKLQSQTETETTDTKTDDLDGADFLRTPRSNRPFGLLPLGHDLGEKSADESDDVVGSSTSRSRRVLPPLQQPLGTKFMEESTTTKKKKKKKVKQQNAYTENAVNGQDSTHIEDASMLESQGEKSMRSVSRISMTTKSLGDVNEDVLPLSSHRLTPLDGEDEMYTPKGSKKTRKKKMVDDILQQNNSAFELKDASDLTPVSRPLPQLKPSFDPPGQDVSGIEQKKAKKKKLRKNQLSPYGQTNGDLDMSPSVRGDYSSRNYPWDTPNPLMDGSDQSDSGYKHQTTDFSTKWGLAEDLPQVAEAVVRSKPNYDDDDDIVL